MNLMHEAKKRPKMMTAGVTAASVIGFFIAWDKLSPTLEFTVQLRNAPVVAAAALEKATEAEKKADSNREFIDAWIKDQKQQREFEQRMAEKEAEYQRQMIELQRQQVQQQAPNRPVIQTWQDQQTGQWWCCYQDCDDTHAWYRCQQ